MAFNPALFTATNKPIGLTNVPVDARTYFYDGVNFVFRAYVDTTEVLAYLLGNNRVGQFSIIINIGGTLVNGVITGGTNAEWWFKDGIADGDLVLKSAGGGGGITALTGDVTAAGTGSVAATLATVNTNVGSYTSANITVDGKGRVTAAANGSSGAGDLLAANNLSDVASMNTSRDNLGFQTVWNRKGIVLGPSAAGDSGVVGEPTVIYEASPVLLTGATSVFKMWFTAGYSTSNIMYAESYDGVLWQRRSTICIANHDRAFVFKVGSTYYCTTANQANTQIDLYSSTDGVTWTLLHAAIITTSASWNSSTVSNSYVLVSGGTWYLYCDGSNGVTYTVGLFTSTNTGATWIPFAGNPISSLASLVQDPFIAGQIGPTYYMFGHSTPSLTGQLPSDIYMSTSTDLLSWTTPVLVFARRSTDEGANTNIGQVADAALLPVGNSMYMWYGASPDGNTAVSTIKLAVANMTLAQLVQTTQGDGGDILNQYPPFSVNPINNDLTYNGGNYSTFAVNAPLYPNLVLESNGAQIGTLGSGQSPNLTGATDLSLIANGSGNMSLEASHLYIYASTVFPNTGSSFGLTSANAYAGYNFNGGSGHFYWLFSYKGATAQQLYFTDAGNFFASPQNANDFLIATTANVVISTNSANDQVDAYAEFNPTSKSLILNGGNAAGFTNDNNLILNVQSTTKGVAFPRMTTTQRLALATTEGEMVYDLTLHKYYAWDGSAWQALW